MLRILLKLALAQALFAVALPASSAMAGENIPADGCFDFSKKVVRPLKEPLEWKKGTPLDQMDDISDRARVAGGEPGKPENGYVWARARGIIHKPIQKVYELLLDHDTTKSRKIQQVSIQKTQDANYLWKHRVVFEVKALLFFSVNWMEEWAYALAKGTREKPESIVMSYQKLHDEKFDTVHIDHLCGNIVLNKVGDNDTDVYLYEEVKAAQRTDEETENGLIGTLMTLRKVE